MEKLEKKKHDHKLTKWLKFSIFATIMLAPFFSVLVRSLYVINNDNAKDSYSIVQSGKYTLIGNQSQLENNTLYQFNATRDLYNSKSLQYIYLKEGSLNTITGTDLNIYPTTNKFRIYYNGNNNSYSIELLHNSTTLVYLSFGSYNNPSNITFTFESDRVQNNTDYIENIELIQFGQQNYLDNVFEYSINQLKENNLYNWSLNTGIYTAIDNMTQGLGANETLSMLLAYWGILTAIYIVFDIIIEIFVKLTHLLAD